MKAAHGALGAAGLLLLAMALGRGLPPSAMGTGGFGTAAAALLGLALALGLAVAAAAWHGSRATRALIAAHAAVAVAGFVVLWTLVGLG